MLAQRQQLPRASPRADQASSPTDLGSDSSRKALSVFRYPPKLETTKESSNCEGERLSGYELEVGRRGAAAHVSFFWLEVPLCTQTQPLPHLRD